MAPNSYRRGIMTGLIVGIALWAILFALATFGIQPKLDSFAGLAPNHIFMKFQIILKGCILWLYLGQWSFTSSMGSTRLPCWSNDRSESLS